MAYTNSMYMSIFLKMIEEENADIDFILRVTELTRSELDKISKNKLV